MLFLFIYLFILSWLLSNALTDESCSCRRCCLTEPDRLDSLITPENQILAKPAPDPPPDDRRLGGKWWVLI